MKLPAKFAWLNLLCLTTFPAAADNSTGMYNNQQMSSNIQEIVQSLQNWGQYIGYDVTQPPASTITNFKLSQTLLNITSTQLAQVSLFYTYLGAIPFNSLNSSTLGQFVPTDISIAGTINQYANATFQDYSGQPATGVGTNSLIDQPANQQSNQGNSANSNQIADPVSQSLLNIMGTPDSTYCMNFDETALTPGCTLTTETKVSNNVIGKLPDSGEFFSPNYIQQFLGQLNSNSLTAPLLYTPQDQGTSGNNNNNDQGGLSADSQAQQAANFIRYVTGGAVPIKLPTWKDYYNLYAQASASSNSPTVTQIQQQKSQATLSRYLANLRTYAAQSSVGISNLYYILSKRLPQTPKQSQANGVQIPSTPQTSQALNEFNMATWRIFNAENTSQSGQTTGQSGNTQWISQINNASSVTVEKEIAILLAEINYQMYLDRQIHERLLLTNSILLMQSLHNNAPSADFTQPQQ